MRYIAVHEAPCGRDHFFCKTGKPQPLNILYFETVSMFLPPLSSPCLSATKDVDWETIPEQVPPKLMPYLPSSVKGEEGLRSDYVSHPISLVFQIQWQRERYNVLQLVLLVAVRCLTVKCFWIKIFFWVVNISGPLHYIRNPCALLTVLRSLIIMELVSPSKAIQCVE